VVNVPKLESEDRLKALPTFPLIDVWPLIRARRTGAQGGGLDKDALAVGDGGASGEVGVGVTVVMVKDVALIAAAAVSVTVCVDVPLLITSVEPLAIGSGQCRDGERSTGATPEDSGVVNVVRA